MSIWLIAVIGCVLSVIIEGENDDSMLGAFVILLILFLGFLYRPIWVEFDEKSITIHFLFGCFQKLDWDSVWKVERQSFPSDMKYYRVFGDSYGKTAFFTSAKIPYTRKIQRLLREYWNEKFIK